MTSSNGNIFRVTGPLCGEFTGPGEFPTQRPVTRSFDVFFDLRLNKRLSKQPGGWWFETPSWSLWRHCYADDKPLLHWCINPARTGRRWVNRVTLSNSFVLNIQWWNMSQDQVQIHLLMVKKRSGSVENILSHTSWKTMIKKSLSSHIQ